jgi:hypothetical protein
LQVKFQDYVTQGTSGVDERVVGTEHITASTRLSVYANAYRLRLRDVLLDDYEALHALVGDDAFDILTHNYLLRHASSHPNIRWFGGRMVEFLDNTPPYSDHPILAETARFEWTLVTAFDAQDAPLVGTDAVARVPPQAWPEMRPVMHASLQLLKLRMNTVEIWHAVQADQEPPQPKTLSEPGDWVVWRQDLQPHFRHLEADELWALEASMAGRSFGELCEGLCDWTEPEQVGLRAATLLKGWVSEGMVTALDLTQS